MGRWRRLFEVLEGKFWLASEQIDHTSGVEKVWLIRFESDRAVGVLESLFELAYL